jgi:RHS repeat-associated protein
LGFGLEFSLTSGSFGVTTIMSTWFETVGLEFPAHWEEILRERFPLYRRLPESDRRHLKSYIRWFVGSKEFEGCEGVVITDEIRVLVAASYRYDSFGNILSQSGDLADANVYRFSSKAFDALSGLYYYGFRWYSPQLQRWVNWDPTAERGGINLFAFARNNSLSFIDAFGLATFTNSSKFPILVSGSPGPGDGQDNVPDVWVVVPPGGYVGGDRPADGYGSRQTAWDAYNIGKGYPGITGKLCDVDYVDTVNGPHPSNKHADEKIPGDDKGPFTTAFNYLPPFQNGVGVEWEPMDIVPAFGRRIYEKVITPIFTPRPAPPINQIPMPNFPVIIN